MKQIQIKEMGSIELMEFLRDSINRYKYDRLTHEQFNELQETIDYAIEVLELRHPLFALPFKLQLGRF